MCSGAFDFDINHVLCKYQASSGQKLPPQLLVFTSYSLDTKLLF